MKQSQFYMLVSFMYLSSVITTPVISLLMGLLFIVFSALAASKDDK